MFEAYNKSLPLSSVCVCLRIAETACISTRQRELKVILMLVSGRVGSGRVRAKTFLML